MRSGGPIERRSKDARFNTDAKILQRNSRDLGRVRVVFTDYAEVEREPRRWLVPALRTDVGVIVITNARKHVVRSPVLRVKVKAPVVYGPYLEPAQDGMGVVVLGMTVGHECRRCVGAEIEATDSFGDAPSAVAIAQMYLVVLIKLVVALDSVLNLSIISERVYVSITEADRISSRTSSNREEVAEQRSTVDLKSFDSECV